MAFSFRLVTHFTNQTLLATLNARDTEPANIVHVEESSYNLKERQQNSSRDQIKLNRPPGMTSSQVGLFGYDLQPLALGLCMLTVRRPQDRADPAIHLQTETAVEILNVGSRRRSSQDQVVRFRSFTFLTC